MTEVELIYRQICHAGIEDTEISEMSLILLQYRPSYINSLLNQVLFTFLEFKGVHWWNIDSNETWMIDEVLLPRSTNQSIERKRDCNFKTYVNNVFGFSHSSKASDHPARSCLIVNRRSNRRLANSYEVMRALKSVNIETTEVYFEDLPFKEQANLVRNHSIVISPHGAGWTMISLFSTEVHILIEVMHITDPCSSGKGLHAHPWKKWITGQYFDAYSPQDSIWVNCKTLNGDGDMVMNITLLWDILQSEHVFE